MSHYARSVLFRLAGAIAGGAFWFGLIILALANFDTPAGFPEELRVTWPFWLVTLIVLVGVFVVRRRMGPGPGWWAFFIGAFAPFVGLILNARINSGGFLWFWLSIAVIVLIPLPASRRYAPAG